MSKICQAKHADAFGAVNVYAARGCFFMQPYARTALRLFILHKYSKFPTVRGENNRESATEMREGKNKKER